MEDALKISKDLDDKMKNMKIAWIASISIYFALKEDKNITNHFTVHSGLLLTPNRQTPLVTTSPLEDIDTME